MSKLPESLTSLDRRVLRQLGGGPDAVESAKDAARHGADSGFNGFISTHDCVAFFKRNRAAILALLSESASDMGETASATLAGFMVFMRVHRDQRITDPMAVLANTRHDDYDTVANALAWFALEETGRKLLDEEER